MTVSLDALEQHSHVSKERLLGLVAANKLRCLHLASGPMAQRFTFDLDQAMTDLRAAGEVTPSLRLVH